MTKISYYIIGVLIVGALGLGLWIMNKPMEGAPVPPAAQPAAEAVKEDVAQKENVNKNEVAIVSVTSKEWPNSCLGINKPELVCLQIITPGYEIVARAHGNTYTYHTNASGNAIVLVE